MNVLLILSALKKGWEYTKGFLAIALEYWYIVIIALLLAIANSLRNDVNKLNAEERAVNLYNALVDVSDIANKDDVSSKVSDIANKTNTDNKE